MMASELADDLLEYREMYRAVISGAIRDIGNGNQRDVASVRDWVRRDSFATCCEIAGWETDWMRDLFKSLLLLDAPVARPITEECLAYLRVMMRVTVDAGNSQPPAIGFGGHIAASVNERELDNYRYSGDPIGKFSAASNAMHARKVKSAGDNN
jgi:hypothetical protein